MHPDADGLQGNNRHNARCAPAVLGVNSAASVCGKSAVLGHGKGFIRQAWPGDIVFLCVSFGLISLLAVSLCMVAWYPLGCFVDGGKPVM